MAGWARQLGARLTPFAFDLAIFGVVFLAYTEVRRAMPIRVDLADTNARMLVDAERALRILHEGAWQSAALDHDWLIELANAVYYYGHLPLIPFVGLVLFLADQALYRRVRNAMLISLLLALPVFYLFPVTPPRLLDELGMTDTLDHLIRSNAYAAVPSYHYGWNALLMGALWVTVPRWWVRGMAVAFSALMWWSIVVTGNHYFLDMVIGVGFAGLALLLSLGLEVWLLAHPRWKRRLTIDLLGHRLPI